MIDARDLLDVMDDAFLVCSASGEIRHANAAARSTLAGSASERSASERSDGHRLAGASLGALLGERALEELSGALAERRERRCGAAARDGRPLSVRIVPREGEAWVLVRADPRPEEARGGEYLRMVLDHAPVVLFSFDADGTLTMSAGLGLERLRVAEGELVGHSIFDRFDGLPWVVESARRALDGEAVQAAGRVDDVDYDVLFQPIRGPAGQVVSVLGVATDVTERERAATRLDAEQTVLRYVLENVPHAIFWKDREGRFRGANQNFLNDTGVETLDQLVGKTDFDVWTPSDASFFVEIDRRVMSTGVPILDLEEPLLRPDGEQRCLLTSKVPTRNASGEITGVLGIYADITRRKEMEVELEKAKEGADAAARAKSEFLTVMSHELRTPLALIVGPIESLIAGTAGELDERAREALGRVQRNARRLHQLVDEVLTHQALEHRTLEVRAEPVDVRELVEELVLDAKPGAERAGLDLELELDADVGIAAIDRRMFEKILFNLLGNALKFTPPGERVTVGLARLPGKRMELSVTDTGPGIAREDHETVFQRFHQLDASTRRRHEGMGLGLALVRDFAQKMGGRVTLSSALGMGARFGVELPIGSVKGIEAPRGSQAKPPPPAPPVARRPPRLRDGALPRVLVAEDNADMRGYIDEILSEAFDVELAETGVAALDAARARRPDVIVSDVMMPEMDGYELTSRLKSSAELRDVPLILLSARASPEEIVRGLEIGADDYLQKPFMPEELVARVRAAFRLHRTFIELASQKRALEDTLRRLADSHEELVEASKMAAIGTLVAGLSHELNNPIGIIRMSAQLLRRRSPPDPRTRRTLEAIERQSTRCTTLVGALLELSRRKPVALERCALEEELRWLLELVGPEANERSIELTVSLDDGALPIVVHRAALESALLNLIGNALDASAEGGAVQVRACPRDHDGRPGAEIVVADRGSGIAREDLPHVFEPFFTTKAPGEGTGLGLTTTYRFVERHGGTIRIESELGRGATVRMWLPLVPPSSAPARGPTPRTEHA